MKPTSDWNDPQLDVVLARWIYGTSAVCEVALMATVTALVLGTGDSRWAWLFAALLLSSPSGVALLFKRAVKSNYWVDNDK